MTFVEASNDVGCEASFGCAIIFIRAGNTLADFFSSLMHMYFFAQNMYFLCKRTHMAVGEL